MSTLPILKLMSFYFLNSPIAFGFSTPLNLPYNFVWNFGKFNLFKIYETSFCSLQVTLSRIFSTLDEVYHQYCEGYSVLWMRYTISTVGWYNQYCGGYSVLWFPSKVFSTLLMALLHISNLIQYHNLIQFSVKWRDIISGVGRCHQDIVGCSLLWGMQSVLLRDDISNAEDVQ